jgi:hypothetical protein
LALGGQVSPQDFWATFGHFWPHLAAFGRIWPHLATFGHIWPHLATFGHIWPHLRRSQFRVKCGFKLSIKYLFCTTIKKPNVSAISKLFRISKGFNVCFKKNSHMCYIRNRSWQILVFNKILYCIEIKYLFCV